MRKRFIALLMAALIWVSAVGACPALAAVTNSTYQNSYTGDGSTTTFTFTFRLIQAADMLAKVNGVTQNGITVVINQSNGVGGGTGGTVTFTSAPANGSTVVLSRSVQYVQNDVLTNYGAVPGPTIETALDALTMQVQQLSNNSVAAAGVTGPASSTAGHLPVFGDTSGKVLADGVALPSSGYVKATGPNTLVGQATPIPTTDGGTGNAAIAANSAVVMNGSGNQLTGVAPGASGNVMVSNGVSWVSGTSGANVASGRLSAAQINSIGSGIDLIPAPPAGYGYVILAAWGSYNYSGTAFNGLSDLNLTYLGTSVQWMANSKITGASSTVSTADASQLIPSTGVAASGVSTGTVKITLSSAALSSGNGFFDWTIIYTLAQL